jgi:hypothetical protein
MKDLDAKTLRDRADEARAVAGQMKHPPAKRMMWSLAVSYDLLARHAEERDDRHRPAAAPPAAVPPS